MIVLVDNDPGGKDVTGLSAKSLKSKSSGLPLTIHVVANLYVMPTPLVGGATETAIEDFFSPQTLGTVLGRQKYSGKITPFDSSLHYGKAIFAEQVIKKNAHAVDFALGFVRFSILSLQSSLTMPRSRQGRPYRSAAESSLARILGLRRCASSAMRRGPTESRQVFCHSRASHQNETSDPIGNGRSTGDFRSPAHLLPTQVAAPCTLSRRSGSPDGQSASHYIGQKPPP